MYATNIALSLRIGSFVFLSAVSWGAAAQAPTWIPQGPSPATGGQVENLGDGEVSGALNSALSL